MNMNEDLLPAGKRGGARRVAVMPRRLATWVAYRLRSESVFAAVLTALFLAFGVLGMLHHEMWRDEMHAWLVARDSSSLWQVIQVTRFEAHFSLWRVVLYALTRITRNPIAMQLVSLLVAAGNVWIVARLSPFPRLERFLFSFGFYNFYEYSILARDYTLLPILMFAFCALYGRKSKSCLGLSVVLCLLANTVPYGFVIALIFTALLVFDWGFDSGRWKHGLENKRALVAGALILLVGFASAGVQFFFMKGPWTSSWEHPLTFAGFADTMTNVWRAYVPIPIGFPYWREIKAESNFIFSGKPRGDASVVFLSALLFVISAGLLLRRPRALFLFVFGTGVLLSVQFVVFLGGLWHVGFLFLLFMASLWIWFDSEGCESDVALFRRLDESIFGSLRRPVIISLLVIQLAAGIAVWGADLFYPFSASKNAARFIRDHGLSGAIIVGSEETRVSPLSGYLDKDIYYCESSRLGSYIDFSTPINPVPGRDVARVAHRLALETRRDVVIVLTARFVTGKEPNSPITEGWICADGVFEASRELCAAPSVRIKWLGFFSGMIDELYNVYLVQAD
jgi:hypothetical protein